ncbi:MAG TPA: hypothetical protein VNU70_09505 [Puia sp.]|jgi:hypothetical protein|nr:hypothetical protein [Puia sp.]
MNGISEILEELRLLSAPVAAISRRTPYEVPEGYFTNFPGLVLLRVAAQEDVKSLIYRVPEGYFDGFAQGVLDRIKAGAMTPSASDAGLAPEYAGTPSPIEAGAPDPVSAILTGVGRVTPYQAPEGYFEELSPLLAVLRDQNPYAAPVGYFEHLPDTIVSKTGQKTIAPAKIISLGSRAARSMAWMKYSAAAVVAGLILTVGWFRWHTAPTENGTGKSTIELAKVSDQELQGFLKDQDTTLAQPLSNTTANIDMNDTDLKTLLGDIPDGELKQYMEEHGGASDIATN